MAGLWYIIHAPEGRDRGDDAHELDTSNSEKFFEKS